MKFIEAEQAIGLILESEKDKKKKIKIFWGTPPVDSLLHIWIFVTESTRWYPKIYKSNDKIRLRLEENMKTLAVYGIVVTQYHIADKSGGLRQL
jgi:hypothetical protein